LCGHRSVGEKTMNFIMLAGHLGSDPEVRFTSGGKKVTSFRVATRARRGMRDEATLWWRVTLWGEQFDRMIGYFKKGSPIVVTGEINPPEIFTDREGKSQVSLSMTANTISFSPFGRSDSTGRDSNTGEQPRAEAQPQQMGAEAGMGGDQAAPFQEEEIPF
jgi:single-strand DNA-binding protein